MLLVGRPAYAQSPADIALARDLFKEGADFAQKGQWNEARQRYEKSLALKRSPRTLYSLGVAYRNLRRFVEALESYRAFLVEPKKEDDKPYEQLARDAIAELETQVARLDIKVVPHEEDLKMIVTIDGFIVPDAAYGYPRLVDPGTHMVVARAEGYQDATQSVTVAEGAKLDVLLRLEPVFKAPIQGSGPRKTEVPVLPTALIAGGSAAFAVGLTIGMVGVQRAMDAPTRDGEDAKTARQLALAGDIIGGVGIATAGAGLTLLLWDKYRKPSRSEAKPSTTWAVPFVAPNGVGVVGRF